MQTDVWYFLDWSTWIKSINWLLILDGDSFSILLERLGAVVFVTNDDLYAMATWINIARVVWAFGLFDAAFRVNSTCHRRSWATIHYCLCDLFVRHFWETKVLLQKLLLRARYFSRIIIRRIILFFLLMQMLLKHVILLLVSLLIFWIIRLECHGTFWSLLSPLHLIFPVWKDATERHGRFRFRIENWSMRDCIVRRDALLDSSSLAIFYDFLEPLNDISLSYGFARLFAGVLFQGRLWRIRRKLFLHVNNYSNYFYYYKFEEKQYLNW